jgi:hypothetical protein
VSKLKQVSEGESPEVQRQLEGYTLMHSLADEPVKICPSTIPAEGSYAGWAPATLE